jgi:hypothetical protein
MKDLDFLDTSKYLAGFQHVTDMVPGFGEISFDATRLSMRVSEYLTGEIRAGKMPGLDTVLPEATSRLGGFSDACHGLWEVPAILSAIPFETECTLERLSSGSGWILDDRRILEAQEKDKPNLFNKRIAMIREQVEALGAALSRKELQSTGQIMNENHKILIEMGLSHERLIYL